MGILERIVAASTVKPLATYAKKRDLSQALLCQRQSLVQYAGAKIVITIKHRYEGTSGRPEGAVSGPARSGPVGR